MAVSVDEARDLESVRHLGDNTGVLRRLLVVGLASAFFGVPALAHAGTVAIFYYPWYATAAHDGAWDHWNQNSHRPPGDLYSRFYPARGPYSSNDAAVLDQQMAEIAAAGVDEIVSSWWGRGSVEDARLPLVLRAARRHHLEPAIHVEPYPGRTASSVLLDVEYLAGLGVRDIFVYHPRDAPAADWAAVRPQLPAGVRLFAGTELVGFAAAGLFDGFYTYDFVNYGGAKFARLCTQAHAAHLLCAPSVGPGYDGIRAGEAPVLSARRGGVTYDNLWTAALAARPDLVTITSYNEWGEGTQIEAAVAHRGYRNYDGAWGLTGVAAQTAYLTRTAYWAGRFHSTP
jgi:glycoprotein endo-alpha-1,2-mannosidase